MKTFVVSCVSVFLFFYKHSIYAQDIGIDTVIVSDYKNRDSINVTYLRYQRDIRSHILESTSAVLNQQGVNSLATVINRGLPSKLFSVFYNGLRLNNINNSSYDLNLLPVFYFDNIAFDSGGSLKNNAFNSAAGRLDIGFSNYNSNYTSIGYKYAYAGDNEVNIVSHYKFDKLNFRVGGNLVDYKNRFKFYKDGVKVYSDEVPSNGYNIITDVSYTINAKSEISSGVWIQDFDRNLPNIYNSLSDQKQIDKGLRAFLNYDLHHERFSFNSKFSYANEELIYKTSIIHSMANTKSLLWQNVFNIQHDWIHSIGLKYDRADANFFQDVKSRADIFYSISKGIKMKKTSIGFTLIQHLVAQKLAPIQGEINLRGDRYFIDIIKNYNLPSFNDLYWPVGGNENLKTENSLQFSGGYTLDIGNHLTSKINLYSSHISNFIQWLPTVNNFWSPINVQKIWSRGVEIEMNYEKKFHLIKFLNSTKYTITKSTYEDDAKNKGSQLIYVPLHKLTNNLSIIKKHFAFDINTTLLGKRYETTDNFTHLNPALLFNASISYQSNIKNIKPKLKLSVQNIFNEHYEFVRLFPQPLRRISLEIKFIF